MLEFVFLLPIVTGLVSLVLPVTLGRGILVVVALMHLQLSIMVWIGSMPLFFSNFFNQSPEGMLILMVTSFIFFFISIYAVAYMKETKMKSEPIFIGCMLLFLGTMSMVVLAEHPIVLWIAIEATTLVSAPLIFINRSQEALEATWKYVLICSVGIALALLGCFFVTLSMDIVDLEVPLTFTSLNSVATSLDPAWLKVGFVFIVIGFGTKMGLAPMHTWLPDAHSQAPGPASALLSGALLNCAFLGIYKMHKLMCFAGFGDFSSGLLIGFGLFSMFVAGVFILHQPDYKRMLAYSSIENMGIIAFGVGIGGIALYGAMLHLIHHSLLKSSLFLSAGNILLGFGTKLVSKIGSLAKIFPKTFVSFFAGFIGISGLPPFGIFISELFIVIGAFKTGHYLGGTIFILLVLLVVSGAARIVTNMSFGDTEAESTIEEKFFRTFPPYALLAASITLCIWMPESLVETINNSIEIIGGGIHG